MNSHLIAEMIVHLARTGAGGAGVAGLTPGQWAVLRYFARANRFSRTPSAFAAFHAATRGTSSQAIKGLVKRGYLEQIPSSADGRSVRLDLTEKARAVLPQDPLRALVRAADALPHGVRGQFADVLQRLQRSAAGETGKPVFGTCGGCAHFEGDGCCRDGGTAYECGFMGEPLVEEELDELCVNFKFGKPAPRPAPVDA